MSLQNKLGNTSENKKDLTLSLGLHYHYNNDDNVSFKP